MYQKELLLISLLILVLKLYTLYRYIFLVVVEFAECLPAGAHMRTRPAGSVRILCSLLRGIQQIHNTGVPLKIKTLLLIPIRPI